MQVGQERFGMQTFNQSLFSLYTRRMITLDEAISRSLEPEELRQMIERGSTSTVGQPGKR
jgi:twitching motility protein PilT